MRENIDGGGAIRSRRDWKESGEKGTNTNSDEDSLTRTEEAQAQRTPYMARAQNPSSAQKRLS
jgi:hypothetical protein